MPCDWDVKTIGAMVQFWIRNDIGNQSNIEWNAILDNHWLLPSNIWANLEIGIFCDSNCNSQGQLGKNRNG